MTYKIVLNRYNKIFFNKIKLRNLEKKVLANSALPWELKKTLSYSIQIMKKKTLFTPD